MTEKKFNISIIVLIIFVIVLLGYNIYQVNSIKKLIPKPISVNELLSRLTDKQDFLGYKNTEPVNILQVSTQNLAPLSNEIPGLDETYLGNFVIVYQDRIIVYDFEQDIVKINTPLIRTAPKSETNGNFEEEVNKRNVTKS